MLSVTSFWGLGGRHQVEGSHERMDHVVGSDLPSVYRRAVSKLGTLAYGDV